MVEGTEGTDGVVLAMVEGTEGTDGVVLAMVEGTEGTDGVVLAMVEGTIVELGRTVVGMVIDDQDGGSHCS